MNKRKCERLRRLNEEEAEGQAFNAISGVQANHCYFAERTIGESQIHLPALPSEAR